MKNSLFKNSSSSCLDQIDDLGVGDMLSYSYDKNEEILWIALLIDTPKREDFQFTGEWITGKAKFNINEKNTLSYSKFHHNIYEPSVGDWQSSCFAGYDVESTHFTFQIIAMCSALSRGNLKIIKARKRLTDE